MIRARRGAALIIVLFLAATLSFVALAIVDASAGAAMRAEALAWRGEAQWLALGAEQLALGAAEAVQTAKDKGAGGADTYLDRPFEFPIDGGAISVRLRDATRCLNLNSVAGEKGSGEALAHLVESLALPGTSGPGLRATIADWIDADSNPGAGGAEDSDYQSERIPYRTAGGPIGDYSELRAMRGVTRAAYTALRPFLCAQPNPRPSPVNLNRLGKSDAALLEALARGGLSRAEAEALIADRPPGGYGKVDEFFSNPLIKDKKLDAVFGDATAVNSRYVDVAVRIVAHGRTYSATLALERGMDGEIRVLSRRIGPVE